MKSTAAKRKQDDIVDEETSTRNKKKARPDGDSIDSFQDNCDDDPPADPSSSSSTLNLHALLDFSSLKDESAISNRFDEIARVLIHEHRLVVSNNGVETAFEIQEMEFYLQKGVYHEDPFTHGSEEQKVSGRWYFHRAPRKSADATRSSTSLTGYRGGTRKGLDLTIGGPPPQALSPYFSQPVKSSGTSDNAKQETRVEGADGGLLRGGILLRSLRGLAKNSTTGSSKSNSVSGPSLLVDRILELSGAPSISELVENAWRGDTAALNPPTPSSSRVSYLYFKRVTETASMLPKIHKSPRIGIDLSHPGTTVPASQSPSKKLHPRVRFLPKMYRYFTRPEELTKGRPQTFYGFIRATLASHPIYRDRSLSGDKPFREILAAGMGIKDAVVSKYLAEYELGRRDGLKHLKSCIGPNGKGAADSPTAYLKMMGALETVLVSSSENAGTRS
ncbi:hypothetical protein P691DRAFT_713474 [Macrolepiota fuliginosa MF-IS2]|uniref:Uncharacterized protein n=1 Tax=Macrolepiota fuliginosa MF-IS2 TaxID=1400762 RepID=A0A9P5X446_9AGAR|nr:hypothetical protein P691DRAFT_713474 [Macrolepiota fuliginosa MF-IS2]